MSSRPTFTPYQVITAGNMATTIYSAVTIIKMLSMISYSLTWTGTSPVGTINVQVSNDYSQNSDGSVKTAGTWTNLPLSATATVSGSTGTGFIDLDTLAAYAIRLQYVASSGTGSLNAIISCKVA